MTSQKHQETFSLTLWKKRPSYGFGQWLNNQQGGKEAQPDEMSLEWVAILVCRHIL